ncbi:MAG: glycosyltransferase [Actinomycetota bacterium]|nr:glycosyltransferase [Actinomycetota bacterium]
MGAAPLGQERRGARLPQAACGETQAALDQRGPLRVMFYSHDTYGLGHLRRTLTLARYLRREQPLLSQLIVTGSPLAHRFELPPGADYVKLPSVVKLGAERYEPRSLSLPFATILGLRQELILSCARHFEPQVLVVDNVPAGLKGELVSTLRYLRRTPCLLVLGLRDVVDEAQWVRRAWARDGSYELLDEVYDRILVYGQRDVYDLPAEYGFSAAAAAKTRFVGYLRREPAARAAEEVRAELGHDSRRLVLVMAGGGGDGYGLLRAVLDAIGRGANGSRFQCLLLGGPFMPEDDRRRVLELAAAEPSIRYLDFVEDVASYIAAADVVVAMGGYNSVCELLSARKPGIIVPRIEPRREQAIRAEALSRRGLFRMIHPAQLTPERLLAEMEGLLERPQRPETIAMDGLPAAGAELDALLAQAPGLELAALGV